MKSIIFDEIVLPIASPIISSLNNYSEYLSIYCAMKNGFLCILPELINIYALQTNVFRSCGMGFGKHNAVNVLEDDRFLSVYSCKRDAIDTKNNDFATVFEEKIMKGYYIIALIDTMEISLYDIVKLHPLLIYLRVKSSKKI